MNVVSFFDSVSRQTSAVAVMALVGQQDAVVILHQPLAVIVHFHPISADTVQQNHGIAVRLMRTHIPGTKHYAIGGCDFDIAKFHRLRQRSGTRIAFLVGSNRRTGGM
jgi:hypothetical protein